MASRRCEIDRTRRGLRAGQGRRPRSAADGLHHSSIPLFHPQAPVGGSPRLVGQNKANFRRAEKTLKGLQERGYGSNRQIRRAEKQSQFPRRVCTVPVRASGSTGMGPQTRYIAWGVSTLPVVHNHGRDAHATETPYGVTTSEAWRAKQSQSAGKPSDGKYRSKRDLRERYADDASEKRSQSARRAGGRIARLSLLATRMQRMGRSSLAGGRGILVGCGGRGRRGTAVGRWLGRVAWSPGEVERCSVKVF